MEKLDRDNFGLKLRIHYLEELQRKSGKEFNDALLKQLTDLQVDKLTLQRDLKHYRRELSSAQEAARARQKSGDASVQTEVDRLQQSLSDCEAEIKVLRETADFAEDRKREIERSREEIGDLEHELRQKDQELDEKDDQIDKLQRTQGPSDEVETLRSQLQERDEDIKGLQDALRVAGAETDRKLKEKDRALELKDDEVRDLEDELRNAGRDESFAAKGRELNEHQSEIDRLRQQLEISTNKARDELADLKSQLESAEKRATSGLQEHQDTLNDKERQIHQLEQKLSKGESRRELATKLQDQISDLEADLREKERTVEEKDGALDELRNKIQQIENDSDEELMAAQDRIQELEVDQQRHLKDLQALRDAENKDTAHRSQAFQAAEERITELEASLNHAREAEKQLQRELHRLRDDILQLERELDEKETEAKNNSSDWAKRRSSLEADRSRAEEKVKSLESAISRLRESEGTLNGKEMALQKLLEETKQQHASAQADLQKRLGDLAEERDELKASLQKNASQLRDAESRGSNNTERQRELQDKIQSLEDEVDVLQTSLDEETSKSKDELSAARSEAESLRRQLAGLKQDLAKAELEHAATKAQLTSLEQAQSQPQATPTLKSTPHIQRELRSRVQKLETEVRNAAHLEAELNQVEVERKSLLKRLEEAETQQQLDFSKDNNPQHNPPNISPSKHAALSHDLATLRTQFSTLQSHLTALQSKKDQQDDELDLLTSDLETAAAARDEALTTVRDLRTQLTAAQRSSAHKFQSQVAAYERDIANLEDELSSARSMQREREIKADSAAATVARLRKRLEGVEGDLAASRARERTSSESPEVGKREQRELLEKMKAAERGADDAKAEVADREAEVSALRSREAELKQQLSTLQRDRRAAISMAEAAASDLAAHQRLHEHSLDDVGVTKLRNRHAAELRGLATQIEFLSAKATRAERLRQDAAFAKSYVGRVVEVYARVHRMDLRLVREMGVVVPIEGEEVKGRVQSEGRMVLAGGRVDATPRAGSRRKGWQVETGMDMGGRGTRKREHRPTFKSAAAVIRACVRMKARKEEWDAKKKMHESVLRKWREGRADRRAASLRT